METEVAQVVALFEEWGEVDRSHRKLAHRGSYLNRLWVSPSSVKRVLAGQGLHLSGPRPMGPSERKPFPEWATYTKNSIWIYNTTHFSRTRRTSATAVLDLVTRKWLASVVSVEETSTQIQVVFTDALDAEGVLVDVEARADHLVDPAEEDPSRPYCWRCRITVPR